MRRSPIQRKSPIRASAAPKAVQAVPARRPRKTPQTAKSGAGRAALKAEAKFARVYGGPDRVSWIQAQPCIVCGKGPCQNAHVGPKGSKGMSYKAGKEWIVPLCATCHGIQHGPQWSGAGGQSGRERLLIMLGHGIDLQHWAQIIDARYDAYVAERER